MIQPLQRRDHVLLTWPKWSFLVHYNYYSSVDSFKKRNRLKNKTMKMISSLRRFLHADNRETTRECKKYACNRHIDIKGNLSTHSERRNKYQWRGRRVEENGCLYQSEIFDCTVIYFRKKTSRKEITIRMYCSKANVTFEHVDWSIVDQIMVCIDEDKSITN